MKSIEELNPKAPTTKKKIKLLVLSHISEYVGGAEKSLVDLFDLWTKEYEIEPEFILKRPAGTLASALTRRGWKYYDLEYTFWSEGKLPSTNEAIFRVALKNTEAVRSIEEIIKKSKPDLVITNSVVCPWAALAAYYQRIPHIWFVREYGDLDHGRVFEIGRKQTLEDVGNLSELVVANSKTLTKHLAQYIDEDKLTTLYNPFNLEKLIKDTQEKIPNPFTREDSLKLVITGSLAPSKGQLEAVEAVGRLNKEGYSAEICLVGGNGPKDYKKQIKKTIKKYNISDKVYLVGHQDNPLSFITLADVGIMASRCEAFGRVTFEYMIAGKPVVGSDSGATPEMIINGNNGYLYKPGDIDSLVNGLKNYAQNREQIIKHGLNSKLKAEDMMQSEFIAENLFKKIHIIINSRQENKTIRPINFTHRWLEYLQAANDYIDETGKTSVKKIARQRVRARAGSGYRLARRSARKILKREW